jgi:hypothetical protein
MHTLIESPSEFGQDFLRPGNRRRSAREDAQTRGLLRAANPTSGRQTSHEVMITDISLHGVGFRSAFELIEGEFYHIEIGVGPLHLSSRLQVTRCAQRPDGYYDAGGEFC